MKLKERLRIILTAITAPLAWLMTRLFLSLLFFVVITPIGIVSYLFNKRFIDLRFDRKNRDSFWIPKDYKGRSKEYYKKQF